MLLLRDSICMGTPCNLTVAKSSNSLRSLKNFPFQCTLMALKDINKITNLTGEWRGRGIHPDRVDMNGVNKGNIDGSRTKRKKKVDCQGTHPSMMEFKRLSNSTLLIIVWRNLKYQKAKIATRNLTWNPLEQLVERLIKIYKRARVP